MFFRSDYKQVEHTESWDTLKPASENGSLARRFFPGYRIAFFVVSGLYVLSMSLALAIILHPEIFQRKSISSSVPESMQCLSPGTCRFCADGMPVPRNKTVVFNGFVDFEVQGTKNDAWARLIPCKLNPVFQRSASPSTNTCFPRSRKRIRRDTR